MVTAFEGSYNAGTKLAMLLAWVYQGCSHSQRTPKSRLSLRLTLQLSCMNAPGCEKRKNPIGSALASVYVRKLPSRASARELLVVLLFPTLLKPILPVDDDRPFSSPRSRRVTKPPF